jgi:MoxR-like ATPase
VTENGVTHRLAPPFVVIATQNPVEHEGTFRLPEAQLDRFLLKLSVGYPSEAEEVLMLGRLQERHPIEDLGSVSDAAEVLALRAGIRAVHVSEEVRVYVAGLTAKTRTHPDLLLGAGPRASLALQSVAQALAWMDGRGFVIPDDVKRAALGVLAHRLVLRTEARLRGVRPEAVVAEVLAAQPVPVETPVHS